MSGQRIDSFVVIAVGEPVDLGWGIAELHADGTLTRTCKGCGVSVTTAVGTSGKVAEAAIHHGAGCTVLARLGNNGALS